MGRRLIATAFGLLVTTRRIWYFRFVKLRDVIRLIDADGWQKVVIEGSHRQYKYPTKPGRVTISGHPGDEMPKGTLSSVKRQAGLKRGKRS